MNINIRKVLTTLQCLGLDLDSGCSGIISLEDVERLSGLRLNSNGSRIIRRDCKVFSKFLVTYFYSEDGCVIAYQFKGYKDSVILIEEASKSILHYKDKLERTFTLLEEAENNTRNLLNMEYFKYSKLDLFN